MRWNVQLRATALAKDRYLDVSVDELWVCSRCEGTQHRLLHPLLCAASPPSPMGRLPCLPATRAQWEHRPHHILKAQAERHSKSILAVVPRHIIHHCRFHLGACFHLGEGLHLGLHLGGGLPPFRQPAQHKPHSHPMVDTSRGACSNEMTGVNPRPTYQQCGWQQIRCCSSGAPA